MNASLTYTDEGISASVRFDRWDSLQSDRARYTWTFTDAEGNVLGTGDDLTIVGDVRESVALHTLAGFLAAWCESTPTHGENATLFPKSMLDNVDVDAWLDFAIGLDQATECAACDQ